jgi:hypothetical protein
MKMNERNGHYLGTEINEKWWNRYTQGGFFARGKGEYWYNDTAFYFLRYLTQDPIVIPFCKIYDVKVGTWHCGRWVWGKSIVKILWSHKEEALSSGFILSYDKDEMQGIMDDISQRRSLSESEEGA